MTSRLLRYREWRQFGDGRRAEPVFPLVRRQIKLVRLQRFVGRRHTVGERALACLIIVVDLREALVRGILVKMFQRQRRAGQIIKDRLKLVMEQRQPMLHARIAAAFADGLVQQIVRRGGAKLGDVTGAKTPNVLGDQLEFRHRHQIEPAHRHFAALGLRVESADGLQRVAEEVETHRHVHSRRKQIENAASHRVLARFAHGRCARKSIELQPLGHASHAEHVARRDRERMRGDEFARRHALQRGVDGREQHRRLVAALDPRQPRQRGHALRHDRRIR